MDDEPKDDASQSEMVSVNLKPCIYCSSEIPPAATMCSVCKQHQSKWKNRILFASGISSLLIVCASGLTYLASSVYGYYIDNYSPPRLDIVDFGSQYANTYGGTFINSGNQDVFIGDLWVTWDRGSTVFTIGKVLKAHTAIYAEMSDKSPISVETRVLALAKPPNIQKVLAKSRYISLGSLADVNRESLDVACLWTAIRSQQSADLEHMDASYSKMARSIVTAPASGILEYVNQRTGSKEKLALPMTLTFSVQGVTSECQKLTEADLD